MNPSTIKYSVRIIGTVVAMGGVFLAGCHEKPQPLPSPSPPPATEPNTTDPPATEQSPPEPSTSEQPAQPPEMTIPQAEQEMARIIKAWEQDRTENEQRLLLATDAEQAAFTPGRIHDASWYHEAGPETWVRLGYHTHSESERIFRKFYFKDDKLMLVTEEMIPIRSLETLSLRSSWKNYLLPSADGPFFKWGGNLEEALSDEAALEQADQLYELVRTRLKAHRSR